MSRTTIGPARRRRKRRLIKQASGFWGARHRLWRTVKEALYRSWQFQYRDRKCRKRDFRRLWITRISAATRQRGLSYSRFINGLKLAGIELNRKMLSEIAIHDPAAFDAICELAQEKLAAAGKA